MDVIIRKGVVQDYEQILALINAFAVFQKTPEKVTVTLEQMVRDKDIFQCLVAEVDNTIVAFASFFFAYYSWSGKAVYVDDLYVKEEYRQANIGTKLLNTVIQFANEQQCKSVRWQVSRWNESAISFYKKLGAVVDETEMNCIYKLVDTTT
ncbi:GNAT family N-acetyltransferase [Ilyomonas limi]|jgi:diamine N-acetyltransferase|uniref:GNAT family N-acetyltransferase n=1 Tax=Ilyomonas limi TaxID=2575867 RepID=A0A4U3L237_9BACT|nr:GNAT family N-acetyltransferase [Ilyomonas limi]TKK69211.1 GNAT family N-acetyltransferase [Ilyomonas limi]